VRTPTGIPADPALASYGVKQAEELATHLLAIQPQPDKLYSSPYYRCLQTLKPYVTACAERNGGVEVWVERGLSEFYGTARFEHPSPAHMEELRRHFDHLHSEAEPIVVPSTNGETIPQLHDRMAYCLAHLIARADQDSKGPKAILVCTHAAAIIAIGRVLTGRMPEDVGEEDFSCFTCGVSTFSRRTGAEASSAKGLEEFGLWDAKEAGRVPDVQWRDGKGVGGGWECEKNSDCSFLENGEERGW
jgi:transcription factor C subunit 7